MIFDFLFVYHGHWWLVILANWGRVRPSGAWCAGRVTFPTGGLKPSRQVGDDNHLRTTIAIDFSQFFFWKVGTTHTENLRSQVVFWVSWTKQKVDGLCQIHDSTPGRLFLRHRFGDSSYVALLFDHLLGGFAFSCPIQGVQRDRGRWTK